MRLFEPERLPGGAATVAEPLPPRVSLRPLRSLRWATILALLAWCAPAPVLGWGGQVKLVRKYHNGQVMVYSSQMHTKAVVHSDPPELQGFLPPLPTDFTVQQQNTVTVKAVHSDGSADIENHFDKFSFQSDLAQSESESNRDSALKAQDEISKHVAGQNLMVHFDRNGRLLGFEGADDLFAQLDLAYREPLRQALRFFLEQEGGDTLYPAGAVKQGGTWTRKLDAPATEGYPYNIQGENTLRYTGKTSVGNVKAAVEEFNFVNVLRPDPAALAKTEMLAQLISHGLAVDMRIDGQGKGRVLLALDDGRVIESHATFHQTLSAKLANLPSILTKSHSLAFEVQSDSQMDLEGTGR